MYVLRVRLNSNFLFTWNLGNFHVCHWFESCKIFSYSEKAEFETKNLSNVQCSCQLSDRIKLLIFNIIFWLPRYLKKFVWLHFMIIHRLMSRHAAIKRFVCKSNVGSIVILYIFGCCCIVIGHSTAKNVLVFDFEK